MALVTVYRSSVVPTTHRALLTLTHRKHTTPGEGVGPVGDEGSSGACKVPKYTRKVTSGRGVVSFTVVTESGRP